MKKTASDLHISTMNNITKPSTIWWWKKQYFYRSFIFWAVVFVLLLSLIELEKPPENFSFVRHPAISGVYSCCDTGTRYSRSTVGEITVLCGGIDYFDFLGANFACGLKEKLNGKMVSAVGVSIPTAFSSSPRVVEIKVDDRIYYEMNDRSLREIWISSSRWGAFLLSFIFAVWSYCIQVFVSLRRENSTQGEKV